MNLINFFFLKRSFLKKAKELSHPHGEAGDGGRNGGEEGLPDITR